METRPLNLMPEFIKKAIDEAIERAIDEELVELNDRLKKRKANIIAGVILYVQKTMNIQRVEDNLIITIKDQTK